MQCWQARFSSLVCRVASLTVALTGLYMSLYAQFFFLQYYSLEYLETNSESTTVPEVKCIDIFILLQLKPSLKAAGEQSPLLFAEGHVLGDVGRQQLPGQFLAIGDL